MTHMAQCRFNWSQTEYYTAAEIAPMTCEMPVSELLAIAALQLAKHPTSTVLAQRCHSGGNSEIAITSPNT